MHTWMHVVCVYLRLCLRRAGCASVSACVRVYTPAPTVLQSALVPSERTLRTLHSWRTQLSPQGLTHPTPSHTPVPPSSLPQCYSGSMTHLVPPSLPISSGMEMQMEMAKTGMSPVPGGRSWRKEIWKRGLDSGAPPSPPGGPRAAPGHLSSLPSQPQPHPGSLPLSPSQAFADTQQLQPLQVYQAPLSLATVPHQALGRTQSSPAAPGGMNSPPDQPTKHLFTTGEPFPHELSSIVCVAGAGEGRWVACCA